MRHASAVLVLLIATACTSALAPTDDSGAGGGGSSACDRAFAAAASVDEMHDTVEDLYPAVRACTSVGDWVAASAANPGAISAGVDPRVFLGNVCGSRGTGLRGTALCRELRKSCKSDDTVAMTMACLHE
jgi:hypothetical protein